MAVTPRRGLFGGICSDDRDCDMPETLDGLCSLDQEESDGDGVGDACDTDDDDDDGDGGDRRTRAVGLHSAVLVVLAGLVQGWAADEALVGASGYSSVGAVVSPRDLESTRRIRSEMPNCIFLVPGFGAQGRTTEEIAECFKPDGTGAVVNASRSIIYAYNDPRYRDLYGDNWQRAVEHACKDFVKAVRSAVSG